VGTRTGLAGAERRKTLFLPGLELRPLGRPVSSQSLHLLRYPGSNIIRSTYFFLIFVKELEI
jgi:hypothetical protein